MTPWSWACFERLGELDSGARGLPPIETPAGLQFVFQVRAADQLHRVVGMAVLNAVAKEAGRYWGA